MIGKVVSGERRNIYEIKAQNYGQKTADNYDVVLDVIRHDTGGGSAGFC